MTRRSKPFTVWHAKRRGLQVLIAAVFAALCIAAILAVAQ
jgi:hypothetical protein